MYPSATTDTTFWQPNEPRQWSPGYQAAIVCRRGHPTKSNIVDVPVDEQGYFADCGAKLLTRCVQCRRRIRGRYFALGTLDWSEYVPPGICDACGDPHPWADRAARIHVVALPARRIQGSQ